MILIDSSVWIDHFRRPDPQLGRLLAADRVLGHPFVAGEVGMGSISQRDRVLAQMSELPQAPVATHRQVMTLIDTAVLWGKGLGFIDAHLIASTRLFPGAWLWSRDKRLVTQAEHLGLAYAP